MAPPDGLILRAAGMDDVPALCAMANEPGYRHGTLRLPFQSLEETRRWFAGLGAADTLLAALIDTADNWLDIRRLELTVYADNAPAIRLYEGFGFVLEGRMRAHSYRAGAYVDTLLMARLRQLP